MSNSNVTAKQKNIYRFTKTPVKALKLINVIQTFYLQTISERPKVCWFLVFVLRIYPTLIQKCRSFML